MKTLVATALIALSLLSSAASAYPYDSTSKYPQWAQKAFNAYEGNSGRN